MAVINVGSLSEWRLLEAGKALDMPGGKRGVRIALISAERAPVSVTDILNGTLTGIGFVDGFEEFLFGVDGHCQLNVTTESDVYFRTDDGHVTAQAFDNEPFVGMMERNPRNPQLEYMMYMQEMNANKRAAQMVEAMEAMLERNTSLGRGTDNTAAAGRDSGAAAAGASSDPDGSASGGKPAGTASAAAGSGQGPSASPSADPK